MRRDIPPSVLVVTILCALGILGFFFHRVFLAPHSYPGASKPPEKRAKIVRTPYGNMPEEQAAKIGFTNAVPDPGRTAPAPGR